MILSKTSSFFHQARRSASSPAVKQTIRTASAPGLPSRPIAHRPAILRSLSPPARPPATLARPPASPPASPPSICPPVRPLTRSPARSRRGSVAASARKTAVNLRRCLRPSVSPSFYPVCTSGCADPRPRGASELIMPRLINYSCVGDVEPSTHRVARARFALFPDRVCLRGYGACSGREPLDGTNACNWLLKSGSRPFALLSCALPVSPSHPPASPTRQPRPPTGRHATRLVPIQHRVYAASRFMRPEDHSCAPLSSRFIAMATSNLPTPHHSPHLTPAPRGRGLKNALCCAFYRPRRSCQQFKREAWPSKGCGGNRSPPSAPTSHQRGSLILHRR